MKRAVGFLFVAALAVCALSIAVVVATERPASADNCKQLIKKLTDLGNKSNMQDCLRTGSSWGRAIGTVTAAVGITIAGIGLIGPKRAAQPTPPADPEKDPARENDPCKRMAKRADRIDELNAERKRREAEILKEWHAYMDTAAFLQDSWRAIKHVQTRTYWAIASARTFNIASLGIVLLGLIGGIKAGIAGMAARTAGLVPATAPPTFVEAWAATIAAAEGAVVGVTGELLPPNVPSPKPFTDPTASELGKTMGDALASVANQYSAHAREFNRAFAQWGTDRQQDLEQLRADTQSELDQWRLDANDCPNASPPPPQPPSDNIDVTTINIIQVPTDIGTTWVGGDWFRWGTGDVF